jgi:ribosomal protein L7/L12
MADKAPIVVLAAAPKEEAEKLQAKLVEIGCKVTLK